MWKLLVGFIVFAAIALFVLKKTGADVDMGGEKHGIESSHPAETAASAPAAPGSAAAAASAASN